MSCGLNYVGEASLRFCFFPPYLKLSYSFPCLLLSLDCGCTIRPNYPSSLNKRYYRFGLNLQLNRRMQSEGDNCSCFGEANIDCGGDMTPSGGRTYYCTCIRRVKPVNNQYTVGLIVKRANRRQAGFLFFYCLNCHLEQSIPKG